MYGLLMICLTVARFVTLTTIIDSHNDTNSLLYSSTVELMGMYDLVKVHRISSSTDCSQKYVFNLICQIQREFSEYKHFTSTKSKAGFKMHNS